eukprot:CAMPEP_0202000016 /NCGR_PEP_ID=MMETSP0905-20130828/6437_1 /ASSEMBLY_ACC=CAM_ASM_000554 /TAXON_ID=420261 /ORGANISM="Thalassiosira antarctica, Strain CCMP982" /LENGTH=339 /DNA_ID=CAMNT_0048556371 /DNA_START=298 /DNA_END=1317 /DNA_ORIENTATION=+
MPVKRLRKECRKRILPVTGRKADLAQRLPEYAMETSQRCINATIVDTLQRCINAAISYYANTTEQASSKTPPPKSINSGGKTQLLPSMVGVSTMSVATISASNEITITQTDVPPTQPIPVTLPMHKPITSVETDPNISATGCSGVTLTTINLPTSSPRPIINLNEIRNPPQSAFNGGASTSTSQLEAASPAASTEPNSKSPHSHSHLSTPLTPSQPINQESTFSPNTEQAYNNFLKCLAAKNKKQQSQLATRLVEDCSAKVGPSIAQTLFAAAKKNIRKQQSSTTLDQNHSSADPINERAFHLRKNGDNREELVDSSWATVDVDDEESEMKTDNIFLMK